MKTKTKQKILDEYPVHKLGDQPTLALLLREVVGQLIDLNDTLRSVSEWQRAIGKKLDEIKAGQGGGQGPW